MEIKIVSTYDREEIGALFSEYTEMLIKGEPSIKEYLEIQNYDEELTHLEDKYGLPEGRLYVAYCGGEAAGCIGLKPLNKKSGEVNRKPSHTKNQRGRRRDRLQAFVSGYAALFGERRSIV